MAQVVCAAHALGNIERSIKLLPPDSPAGATVAAIRSAMESLAAHPLVGRRVDGDVRELVISYGATGYIALYRFDVQLDEVRVLALRHQREIGYLP